MGIRTRIGSKHVLLAVAGIVIAGLGLWVGHGLPTHTATPQVRHGTVIIVGAGGDEFAVDLDGSRNGTGFALGAVPWKDSSDSWHQGGTIDCLKPMSKGQRVTLGVVYVNDPNATGDLVAWVDCS
jgi:hypothetical protein